jgi:hypothetical protein
MKYRIRNCRSTKLKQKISEAFEFYIKKLIHPNLIKHLYVTILINPKLEDNYGECMVTYLDKKLRPRKFLITINPKTEDPLFVLAHEMVHVKQYAIGELSPCHTSWKSLRVNEEKLSYKELPWEKQALKQDYFLYQQFLGHKQKYF